jgi:hypothetical protein
MDKKKGRRPRRETAMPCAPPKEEEVRVGYLKQLLRAMQVLYAKEKPKFKKKIKKNIFILEKSR